MYNVLTEQWIPVRDKKGTLHEMGILEVLNKASELVEITDSMVNYEYGMYRFLFVFLMDVYKPRNRSQIEELLDAGEFDMDEIERYVKQCNKDGERFDLFDSVHPFLQCGEKEWDSNTQIKSVANLNPMYPCGNNHVHFDHNRESSVLMEPKEAVKALCAINLFCALGGRGFSSTLCGYPPPVYSMVKGKNLFETLVFGMVPTKKSDKYDDPAPQWRGNTKVESKKEVEKTSLLYGLLFPCRKIRLLPDESGCISKVYFEPGMNYYNYDAWSDPYVTYLYRKNVRYNLKPSIEKENWRNLGAIFDCSGENAAEVIRQYVNITDDRDDEVQIQTYAAVVVNNASYLDIGKGEYAMPCELIKSPERFLFVVQALEYTEKMGKKLNGNIQNLQKEMGFDIKSGSTTSERKRTVNRYFFTCKQEFFKWIRLLTDTDFKKMNDCLNLWKKTLHKISLKEYDTFVDRLGAGIDLIMKAEKIKAKNYGKGNKVRNER